MKNLKLFGIGIGCALIISGVATLSPINAFFWQSEPEPSVYETYIQSQSSSEQVAQALKTALEAEFGLAKTIYADQARQAYSDTLEEDPKLKQAWTDRGGDLERLEEYSGRDLIALVQWAMYEKTKEPDEPGKSNEAQVGVFNLSASSQ